jgi:hypothetical protein
MGSVRPHPGEVASAGGRVWAECSGLSRQPAASPWFRDHGAQLASLGESGT